MGSFYFINGCVFQSEKLSCKQSTIQWTSGKNLEFKT